MADIQARVEERPDMPTRARRSLAHAHRAGGRLPAGSGNSAAA